jgi:Ca2+-binding RTX toxin-like protein
MPELIAHRSLNQATDVYGGLIAYTEVTTTTIGIQTTRNTTQELTGTFFFEGEGGTLSGGSITGFAEYLSDASLWYSLTGLSVPYTTYSSFFLANDHWGLQSVALQSNDIIRGSSESDGLAGFAGNDTISGGGDNDGIVGHEGNDDINGNQGRDIINGNQGDDVVRGGQGNDTLHGGKDNDWLNGNLDDDFVQGNFGDDTVRGGKGNDTIRGGQGNDELFGDIGGDVIYGDKGDDTLTGGAGADVFVFAPGGGVNVITDFQDNVDSIRFLGFSLSNFEQIVPFINSASDGSAILSFNGDSVTLLGVTLEALDANDFLF